MPQWPCRQHHHPPVMTQTQVGHVTLGLSWPEAEMMYSFASPWSAVFRRRACPGERQVVSSNSVTLARDLPVVLQSDVHCHCPGFLYSALRSCRQLSVQKIMRCPGYFWVHLRVNYRSRFNFYHAQPSHASAEKKTWGDRLVWLG